MGKVHGSLTRAGKVRNQTPKVEKLPKKKKLTGLHGSLTRAGKVRNQTPKVEKLPKKKKLTGRAKMRFLYNKRFVHVVEEQGRRRTGPNSNKNK
ncbi:40S ribosomal protein S30/UBIQUITIN-LIKE PROTEIN FUBI [Anaeramoeba flamelloides]|uniref:40S ribosomal protein S30/UBIQUITIN-LIKE PROTEIN FUBI n=1 Tax=Anaeramoeba flamelloides TaxID=1746091 RepID=A0AAV7Z676_9EUKA|nr:40S ribosomal protein S30/UBIQUITIN-LIKE PROTEIN FUBI [Anaeramoeba flamelloides]